MSELQHRMQRIEATDGIRRTMRMEHFMDGTPEDLEKERDESLQAMANGDLKGAEFWDMNDRYEAARDIAWSFRILQVSKKYTKDVMRALLAKEFDSQIAYAQREQKREYDLNDERRAKGMPFKERMDLFRKDRIAMLGRQEERLVRERAAFVPVPIESWFTQSEYDLAAKRGIEFVIRLNFMSAYALVNNNYEQENY